MLRAWSLWSGAKHREEMDEDVEFDCGPFRGLLRAHDGGVRLRTLRGLLKAHREEMDEDVEFDCGPVGVS
jgi:hypothetical protein